MNACMRSRAARRSGPTISVVTSPSRIFSTSPRRSPRSGTLNIRLGSTSSPLISSRTTPAMWPRSHGTPPNWSAWVISWRATQRSSSSLSASRLIAAWARLGETNSNRAGASGSRIGNSYWPSTRWPSMPEIAPTSTAMSAPPAARAGPASAPRVLPRVSVTGSITVRSELRLLWIQSGRSTGSGCGSTSARRPVYSETRRALSSAGPATCSKRAASGAAFIPAMPSATVAASFQSIMLSMVAGCAARPASACGRTRAGGNGRDGTASLPRHARELLEPTLGPRRHDRRVRGEVERRAEGARAAWEGDVTAGLADDELPGGGVDRAAALDRHHAIQPRGGDLAERRGDRPERAQAVGALGQLVDRLADPARVGRLDPEQLELAVGAAALAGRPGQAAAVEPRALPAPGDPLLARTEVVDVAEEDVGHRPAIGHRDRDRVVRQAALRVDRAVDRVDDHERLRAAELDRAALLADRREAQALLVELRELCEHGLLGRGVDEQRAVAALTAGADLAHPLRGARTVLEDRAQGAGRTAADPQPVGVLGGIRGGHRAYPTVVSPTPLQLEAVAHAGGPLLVLGGAGTGKTTVLCDRFGWLVRERGLTPESILALTVSEAGATALRERLEGSLEGGFEELAVTTVHGFCARLLHDEALEAGLDPFAAPVTPADRVAMLLERIDELPLASHDIRGNPSALLGSIVGRIDRLKDELVSPEDYSAWAGTLGPEAEREREFAAIYAAHDRMLEEAGTLDSGDLLLHAFRFLRTQPRVRARVTARYRHVLVDELEDANFAQGLLVRLLAGESGQVTAAGDDDQAIHRLHGAAAKNLRDFQAEWPGVTLVRLEDSLRCPERILGAARAVAEPAPDRIPKVLRGRAGTHSEVAFWRCESERAQAQAVAAEIERLVAREERSGDEASGRGRIAPEDICVLVRSVRNEGQAVAVALEERAVPHRLAGAAAFFQRAEVRDLLAWLRLLVDPGDAGAVVRALARPPVELRAIDIARCTQIARRRKLDLVAGLGAALESPQVPPEARERIRTFFKLYRAASAALDSARPDLYVHRLIERLGLRRQLLFAASVEVVERLVNLAKFAELAAAYVR